MYLEWDYDTRIWIEIPTFDKFDPWQDPGVWAREVAQDSWGASGLRPRRGEVDNLIQSLIYLAQRRREDDTRHAAHFIYLPHPQHVPHRIKAWIAHHPECSLRDWVVADDPEAIEPPILEDFDSPHLGHGLRAYRLRTYTLDEAERALPGELYAVLRYAFPVDGERTAVVVTAAVTDPAHLLKAMPHIDDLVRNLFLVDRDGHTIQPVP